MMQVSSLRSAFVLAALFIAGIANSQGPASDPTSPVGHWVAEHPSQGGIGSWWDFRSDGTVTMHIGAIVALSITRSGNTFTSPPVIVGGTPIVVTWHVEGDTLHLQSPNAPDQTLSRVGPAPSTTDPLLGKWKPLLPSTSSGGPDVAQQKAMANAILTFSADNIEAARIPFTSAEGNWNASTHTFHLHDQPTPYSYQRIDEKLTLGQPPDNKKTDTYIPDPML
jgi:hypothetical protein